MASAGAAGTLVGVFDGDVAAAAAELETGELEKRRLRGLGFFTFGPLLLAAAAFDIGFLISSSSSSSFPKVMVSLLPLVTELPASLLSFLPPFPLHGLPRQPK